MKHDVDRNQHVYTLEGFVNDQVSSKWYYKDDIISDETSPT